MITNNAGQVPADLLSAVISSETNGYNEGQAGYAPGEFPPGGIGQMSLGEVADTYKRLMDQGADSDTMSNLDRIISNELSPDLPDILKQRASDDPIEAQNGEAAFQQLWPKLSADLAASGGNVVLEGQDAVDMVSLSLSSLKKYRRCELGRRFNHVQFRCQR